MSAALPSVVLEHDRYRSHSPSNALTVDVEEHFQVAAFERQIARDSWGGHASRVVPNTSRVLDLFPERGVHGTFFVLGWVAKRYPDLVRRIVGEGHELASHGYDHTRVIYMDAARFRADVTRTKAILEDAGGVEVRGYRAPSYSIDARNLWALDVLQEARQRPDHVVGLVSLVGEHRHAERLARVVDERDPAVREAFRSAIRARIGWAPDEPEYHCFSIDVERAGFIRFTPETMETWRWTPEAGFSTDRRPND